MLAIRELDEAHTGENISEVVYDVAKEYGIVDNLGYFMMGNAKNNDMSLEELNKRIQEDGGFGFDPLERRLRCFGHIMNLAVKDLFYGPKKKSRPSDAPYRRALDASWGKLCKYYKLTDKSPVYVVTGMLDPRMKYQYFEHRWELS